MSYCENSSPSYSPLSFRFCSAHAFQRKLTLDGNASIQESAFTIPPTNAKASGKKRAISNNGTQKQSTVDRLPIKTNDVRIPSHASRKRQFHEQQSGTKTVHEIVPAAVALRPVNPPGATMAVTPSPLPSSAMTSKAGNANLMGQQTVAQESRPAAFPGSVTGAKRLREPQNSSWKLEKRAQKTLQQSAFRRQKDNPFSLFSYDPNNAESNLQAMSSKSAEGRNQENDSSLSVIPPDALSASTIVSSAYPTSRAVFSSARKPPFGSGGRKAVGRSRGGKGNRRRIFPPPIPDRDFLHMKAMELQAYEDATSASRPPRAHSSRVQDPQGPQYAYGHTILSGHQTIADYREFSGRDTATNHHTAQNDASQADAFSPPPFMQGAPVGIRRQQYRESPPRSFMNDLSSGAGYHPFQRHQSRVPFRSDYTTEIRRQDLHGYNSRAYADPADAFDELYHQNTLHLHLAQRTPTGTLQCRDRVLGPNPWHTPSFRLTFLLLRASIIHRCTIMRKEMSTKMMKSAVCLQQLFSEEQNLSRPPSVE